MVDWSTWGNEHRLLLQTFLHRKVISHSELLRIIKTKAGDSQDNDSGEGGGDDEEEETDYEEVLETDVVYKINTTINVIRLV